MNPSKKMNLILQSPFTDFYGGLQSGAVLLNTTAEDQQLPDKHIPNQPFSGEMEHTQKLYTPKRCTLVQVNPKSFHAT